RSLLSALLSEHRHRSGRGPRLPFRLTFRQWPTAHSPIGYYRCASPPLISYQRPAEVTRPTLLNASHTNEPPVYSILVLPALDPSGVLTTPGPFIESGCFYGYGKPAARLRSKGAKTTYARLRDDCARHRLFRRVCSLCACLRKNVRRQCYSITSLGES